MKNLLYTTIAVLTFALCGNHAQATVQIDLQIGGIYQSDGTTKVPIGSIGVLVASTTDSSFLATNTATSSSLAGTTLSVGSFLGGSDDMIVKVLTAKAFTGTSDNGFSDVSTYTLTGNWNAGDALAIYWFPTITTAGSTVQNGTSFGFFTSSTFDSSVGGSSALVTPSDSSSVNMYYFTQSVTGQPSTVSASQLSATQTVTAVPEPSTFALVGLGMGFAGWMARRNKKA